MTKASVLGTLAEGHGLDDKMVDTHYAAREKHQQVAAFPAVVLLRPVEHLARDTAKGQHRQVKYEIVMLEPEHDPDEVGRLRYRLQNLYDARNGSHAPMLPLDFPGQANEEKRLATIEVIEAWADEEGVSVPDGVGELWREYWGIGAGEENSWGDRGVPANYKVSALAWLLEFAWEKRILEPPEPVKAEQEALDGDALATPDDDPLAAETDGDTGE
jgi:L-fucose mutarotase/ribose pyranase (RbsD/FucU family)